MVVVHRSDCISSKGDTLLRFISIPGKDSEPEKDFKQRRQKEKEGSGRRDCKT